MLVDIRTECPDCGAGTTLAVSRRGDGKQSLSATSCRACGARIVTMTLPDGHAVLQGSTGQKVVFIHHPDPGPAPGDPRTFVPPPERFGLFDPRYGIPPARTGLSDAEFAAAKMLRGDQILFRPDGTRRAEAAILGQVGFRSMWVAQLGHEIAEKLAGPPALVRPPAVFVSYRWQDEARNEWVERLVEALKARGYQVVYDRDEPPSERPDVPELVSRIAQCRYFLAVVDPGYVERTGQGDAMRDGWVFDEYQTALALSSAGRLRVIGLVREGGELPGFRFAVPGREGNACDLRPEEALDAFLDQVFPPLLLPHDPGALAAARAVMAASHAAFLAGDVAGALVAAAEVSRLCPGSPDGALQAVRIALRADRPRRGLAAAVEVLRHLPRALEPLIAAAHFARLAGEAREAAGFAVRVLDQRDGDADFRRQARSLLASALDDLDLIEQAIAHQQAVISSPGPAAADDIDAHVELAYMLRRAGRPDAALALLCAPGPAQPSARLSGALFAAALETGALDRAREALSALRASDPRRELDRLEALLSAAGAGAEIPPLVARVAQRDRRRILGCSECAAAIPLSGDDRALCAMCGCPAAPVGPCTVCGADGKLLPGLPAAQLCPFCETGSLELRPPKAA